MLLPLPVVVLATIACTSAPQEDARPQESASHASECAETGCADAGNADAEAPTPEQAAQIALLRTYVSGLEAKTGYARPLDFGALAKVGETNLLRGDGKDATLIRELRRAQLGVPQGHQDLLFKSCGQPGGIPYATSTRYGVCARPNGDSAVVTSAAQGNRLGLGAGDRIVGVRDGDELWKAPGFLERVALEPVCGSSSPSASHRREWAAASLFGVVRPGMKLSVVSVDGKSREVVVGEPDATSSFCTSPFGGVETFTAKATLRADGIGVIRVPGFVSPEHPLPTPLDATSYAAWVSEHIALVAAELDKVKGAPGIVWDVRSNYGGAPEVAMAIVAGMPGATAGSVAVCKHRVEGSKPAAFGSAIAQSYAVGTPGGPFAYKGKVAVLTDGMTYSAGDYFVEAVRTRAHAKLVGSAPAGAYGYGGNPLVVVEGPPKFGYKVDDLACFDPGGEPLEGRILTPDDPVEYAPADLAAGRDTVLERGVLLVKP